MAIEVYDLTYQNVLDDCGGIDDRAMSATSNPVGYNKITEWIERGGGILAGILAAESLVVADENAEEVCREFIIAYAKVRVYEKLNRHTAKQDAMNELRELRTTIRLFPSEVSGALQESQKVASNVDPDDPHPRKFVTYNSTRKDGFRGW